VLGKTAAASAVTATVALITLSAFGEGRKGIAFTLGLGLGVMNLPMMRMALAEGRKGIDFRATSLFRLGILSAVGVALSGLLGWSQGPLVMAGVGLAQLLIAGVAAARMLRA
jgi:hypothetical protein